MMERRKRDGESDGEKWEWDQGGQKETAAGGAADMGRNLPNGMHEGERRKGELYGCKERGTQS